MKHRYLFSFIFDDEELSDDESHCTVYLIKFSTELGEELIKYFDGENKFSSRFHRFIEHSEDTYGVHDVGFMPSYYLMGFSSDEVEPDEHIKVMNNIRSFFMEEGFNECEIINQGMYKDLTYITETDIAHEHLSQDDIKALNDLR